jgi:hypothetical protein
MNRFPSRTRNQFGLLGARLAPLLVREALSQSSQPTGSALCTPSAGSARLLSRAASELLGL